MLASQFLPLDLATAHLDGLGMAWIARRQALFGTTTTYASLSRLDCRISNHIRALRKIEEEAVRTALVALHDTWQPRVFAGAYFLLHLPSEKFLDSMLDLVPRGGFALLDALRHAPLEVTRRGVLEQPAFLDAVSMQSPIPDKLLRAFLEHDREEFRRAALLAASRAGERGRPYLSKIEHAAIEGAAAERLVAFYALGRIGGADQLDSQSDEFWEQVAANVDLILVAAVFGSRRVVRLITSIPIAAIRQEHVHALGLAGRVESLGFLVNVLKERAELADESTHALYLMTGQNLPSATVWQGWISSVSNSHLQPVSGKSTLRLHLGHDLSSNAGFMSHAWLQTLAAPCSKDWLSAALPDWLLGGGYAAAGWPRLSLGPRRVCS